MGAGKATPNDIIGQRGRVTVALNPVGSVQVKSELWSAVTDEPAETRGGPVSQ
jgi:membrane protein implicated in regulation of membrane protease activity